MVLEHLGACMSLKSNTCGYIGNMDVSATQMHRKREYVQKLLKS